MRKPRQVYTLFGLFLLTTTLGSGLALAADEECPQHPQSEWMSQEAITAKAKELGYDVRGVKEDDGCYQVKGYDKDGKRVQAYFDTVSGELLMVQH